MTRPWIFFIVSVVLFACNNQHVQTENQSTKMMSAQTLLGNPSYPAISYGGYRQNSRDIQPTVKELKEDMRLLSAMGIRMLRTYNVQLDHASNVLKAIRELKNEDDSFEMYLMLGAWIDCKNAWTDQEPDHDVESGKNAAEIERAVALTKEYPDIIKIIAVGNEAMVKWATSYYVQPDVILKWVNHLQELKGAGELPGDLWITSSDNFASWGGGGAEYHVEALNELIRAVDFISMHTYPMHDTHYNPSFWGILEGEDSLSKMDQIDKAMIRALAYAQSQYASVQAYVDSLGVKVPIHIGETGWASMDAKNHHYGVNGSKATDEYKEGIYYRKMREWTDSQGISCFYFEAFDEPWKDAQSPQGSENHFGLFEVGGQAKFAIWDLVDRGLFEGLSRGGDEIRKTNNGNLEVILEKSPLPPRLTEHR
jgi:exo-beta-1,3-glucanase (GH17 family)